MVIPRKTYPLAISAWTPIVLLLACGHPAVPPTIGATGTSAPPAAAHPRPEGATSGPTELVVPSPAGPFAPSRLELTGDMAAAADEPSRAAWATTLADVANCASCHATIAGEWRGSAHANASFNNPWYRAVADRYRADVGDEGMRFCAGCHDPLLLISGAIARPVDPADPLAHRGITCLICHSVQATHTDGNASYALRTDPVPIPVPGDLDSLERHRQRVRSVDLYGTVLCGSCHRGFLGAHSGNPNHLGGIDQLGAYSASAYAGSRASLVDRPVAVAECRDCHMPRRSTGPATVMVPSTGPDPAFVPPGAGPAPSHRFHGFPGAHSAMAASRHDAGQLAAVRSMLVEAAEIHVPAVLLSAGSSGGVPTDLILEGQPGRPLPIASGATLTFLVVVRNVGVGHNFPGGVRDTQDTWIEATLSDRLGRPRLRAGDASADGDVDGTWALRSIVVDDHGRPDRQHLVHRFRAVAVDQTIAPRDARVARFVATLPEDVGIDDFPLRFKARLRHRRHMTSMQDFACEAERSARGRAFAITSAELGTTVSACASQPITEIDEATLVLDGATARDLRSDSAASTDAVFGLALGLSHGLEGDLTLAQRVIQADLARMSPTEGDGDSLGRAMRIALWSRIEGRRGRVDQALARADEAEALIGPHPAIARARGYALRSVWRWRTATAAFAAVVEQSPRDTAAFRDLALAAASAGQDEIAIAAMGRGLSLQPRDEALLRLQVDLLRRRGEDGLAAGAAAAFELSRAGDETANLLLRCSAEVRGCDWARRPIPTIVMVAPVIRRGERRSR